MVLGEPQLGRRGLYPSISKKGSTRGVRKMLDLISYADGKHSLLDIAERLNVAFWDLHPYLQPLVDSGVLNCDDGDP
jgi:aminopeptidase-like protein